MNSDISAALVKIVRACDATHMCTCGAQYPDVRQMTNAMNRDTQELNLYFMTGATTPKYEQLVANPKCTLYYFDDKTRHALRLFGRIEFVTDMATRERHWHEDYKKFGYVGPADNDFVLMRFIPEMYKFYNADGMQTGTLR